MNGFDEQYGEILQEEEYLEELEDLKEFIKLCPLSCYDCGICELDFIPTLSDAEYNQLKYDGSIEE